MFLIQRNETPVLTIGLSYTGSPQGTASGIGSKRRSSTTPSNGETFVAKNFEVSLPKKYRPLRMQVFGLLNHSTLGSNSYAVKSLFHSLLRP